jgi:hypothetical protein
LEEFTLKKSWVISTVGDWHQKAQVASTIDDNTFSSLHLQLVIEKTKNEIAVVSLKNLGRSPVNILKWAATCVTMAKAKPFENSKLFHVEKNPLLQIVMQPGTHFTMCKITWPKQSTSGQQDNSWCDDLGQPVGKDTFALELSITVGSSGAGCGFLAGSYNTDLSNPDLMFKDLEKLLFSPEYSDWTLICDEQRIPCHQILMAARSPVFKTMFDQEGFHEHTIRESEIKDMDVFTLKALLTFIYSNKIVSENIPDLFAAADMYNIQPLRLACEKMLVKSVNVENCMSLYTLAYLHNSKDLKKMSTAIIYPNLEKIKTTPAYSDLKNQPYGFDALSEMIEIIWKK